MTIKAILFDKDGTLIDFDATFGPATARVIEALADGDSNRARDMADTAKFDLDTFQTAPDSILIAGSLENIASAWQSCCKSMDSEAFINRMDALFERHSLDTLTPFDTLLPMLDAMNAMGIKTGLATNDSESAARAHLSKLDIEKHFAFIAGYDSGFGEKPAPGMVLAFAKALRLSPDTVAIVGDSERDCRAGRSAGALTIGVTTGHATRDELAPYADHVLPGIDALPGLIEKLNAEGATRTG